MAYMASASDISLSNHFNKIAATGYNYYCGAMRRSSSPTHDSSSPSPPTDINSMASFCSSFANSDPISSSSYQSTGSPAAAIHHGWCGDLALVPQQQQQLPCSAATATSAELVLAATSVKNGESAWPHDDVVAVDAKGLMYGAAGSSLASRLLVSTSTAASPAAQSCSGNNIRGPALHHMIRPDAAMIRELIDRMGGGCSSNKNIPGSVPPSIQAAQSKLQPHQLAGHIPMEKLLMNHGSSSSSSSWSSDHAALPVLHATTVDPCSTTTTTTTTTTGGLQQAGTAGSTLAATSTQQHCLNQFSSDPAANFAERAAATFSSGSFTAATDQHPQQAPAAVLQQQQQLSAVTLTDSPMKLQPRCSTRSGGRSGGQHVHEISSSSGKLSRTSSTLGVKINIGAHAGEAAAAITQLSDDAAAHMPVEPPCSGNPSLEAIEGARENSVADGAAGLEKSDGLGNHNNNNTRNNYYNNNNSIGLVIIHGGSATEAPPSSGPEKLKRKLSLTADDKKESSPSAASSLCQESAVVVVVENEAAAADTITKLHKRCKVAAGDSGSGPRKLISTTAIKDEVSCKAKAAEGSCCNDNNSDNDSTQGRLKETNPIRKLPHVDICKQDYIHVRARRGQATDSHSLAERVRREKISERMKYLQDLVPGCSKVTGKAVMLDEIINYVQSLQRQVEHLSMKLASVPPQMDAVHFDPVINKEMLPQPRGAAGTVVDHASLFNHHAKLQQPLAQLGGALGAGAIDFRRSLSCNLETGSNCDTAQLRRCISSVDTVAFQDSGIQGSTVWDGDLQSIVQMGILQYQPTSMMSQGLNCHLPVGHLKVEL